MEVKFIFYILISHILIYSDSKLTSKYKTSQIKEEKKEFNCQFINTVEEAIKDKRNITARASIDSETLVNALNKYVNTIKIALNNLIFPEFTIPIDLGFGFMYLYINDFKLDINYIPEKSIKVDLKEPNLIHISLDGIKSDGTFNFDLEFWFFHEKYNGKFDVPFFNFDLVFKIGQTQIDDKDDLKYNKTYLDKKYLPCVELNKTSIVYDFNLDIQLSILGALFNKFEENAKNYMKSFITKTIKSGVKNLTETQFTKIAIDIGLIPSINDNIYLDATLSGVPFVYDQYLIYDSNFLFFDKRNESTFNPPFYRNNSLPYREKENSFHTHFFGREYLVLSALNTFSQADLLNVLVNHTILDPSPEEIHLTTDFLDRIIGGYIEKYGNNKYVDINVRFKSPFSNLVINSSQSQLKLKLRLMYLVEDEKVEEPSLVYDIFGIIRLNASISLDGHLKAYINEIILEDDIEIVESRIGSPEKNKIFTLTHQVLDNVLGIVNDQVLTDILLKYPLIDNNSLDKSNGNIKNDYVSFGVDIEFIKSILMN